MRRSIDDYPFSEDDLPEGADDAMLVTEAGLPNENVNAAVIEIDIARCRRCFGFGGDANRWIPTVALLCSQLKRIHRGRNRENCRHALPCSVPHCPAPEENVELASAA